MYEHVSAHACGRMCRYAYRHAKETCSAGSVVRPSTSMSAPMGLDTISNANTAKCETVRQGDEGVVPPHERI